MTKSAEPSTPSGSSETQQRRRQITSYKNTTTSPATDSRLGVSKMTVVRLIRDGLLPARQVCARAPYVIREDARARPAIRQAIARVRPISADPRQEILSFQ